MHHCLLPSPAFNIAFIWRITYIDRYKLDDQTYVRVVHRYNIPRAIQSGLVLFCTDLYGIQYQHNNIHPEMLNVVQA